MTLELYKKYFGLTERPFSLLPDPDFLFWSPAHKRAFLVLEYGLISRALLTVITGEVGAGKTTLLQALLRTLEDDIVVGLISNAQGGRGDLIRWILNALNVPHDKNADYVEQYQVFQDFVVDSYSEGKHVVLIIDEAQNLSIEALEELRMLTNMNTNKDEVLQLILVGQPELQTMIGRPELRQFAQRVSATFHLPCMDFKTTCDYMRHRLRHAGGTGFELRPAAMELIHEQTSGIPRMVNKLCDLALVYAAGAGRKTVSAQLVQELIDDGIFVPAPPEPPLLLTNRINHQKTASQ